MLAHFALFLHQLKSPGRLRYRGFLIGGIGEGRTPDQLIKSQLLYRLSYDPT